MRLFIAALMLLSAVCIPIKAQPFNAGDMLIVSFDAQTSRDRIAVVRNGASSPQTLLTAPPMETFRQALVDQSHYGYAVGFYTIQKFDAAGTVLMTYHTQYLIDAATIRGDGSLVVAYEEPRAIDIFDTSGNIVRSIDVQYTPISPLSLDLGADQCTLYYADRTYGTFDICRGETTFQRFNLHTNDVVVLPDGNVLLPVIGFIPAEGTSLRVYRMTPDAQILQTYFVDTENIALGVDGDTFWSRGFNSGILYQVDIATGATLRTIAYPTYPVRRMVIVGAPIAALASPAIPAIDKELLIALAIALAATAALRLRIMSA